MEWKFKTPTQYDRKVPAENWTEFNSTQLKLKLKLKLTTVKFGQLVGLFDFSQPAASSLPRGAFYTLREKIRTKIHFNWPEFKYFRLV